MMLAWSNPAQAVVKTAMDAPVATNAVPAKKMTFKEKFKLIREIRKARKAAKKGKAYKAPEGMQSIMQNRTFVLGLILLGGGIILGALPLGIVRWFGGIIALDSILILLELD